VGRLKHLDLFPKAGCAWFLVREGLDIVDYDWGVDCGHLRSDRFYETLMSSGKEGK
jgi:hypothetical protein